MQCFEQLALTGRQTQVRSIAAGEARIAHLHLLAFDIAGQSSDEHDDVGSPRHFERFIERRLLTRPTPRQSHLGVANVLEVFQSQRVRPARLQLDRHARAAHTLVHLPAVQHCTVVEEQSEPVVRAHDQLVTARLGRQQLPGPAHAEIVAGERILIRQLTARDRIVGGRAAVPAKCNA